MNILVINAGSSSLKSRLFDMATQKVLASCLMERIGDKKAFLTYGYIHGNREKKITQTREIADHEQGMLTFIKLLVHKDNGVIDTVKEITAIGHRVVQGGEAFSAAVVIDDTIKKTIQANIPLAPLHNPANLVGIEVAEQIFKGTPNIAVFDTQFHQTMPRKSFLYGLPYEYYTRFKIRKYGFHGTSHKYVSIRAANLMQTAQKNLNLITIHLGNGCSLCAVQGGKCKDTSMGMTPLAGPLMGTRCGDIDPAVIGYLIDQTGLDTKSLDRILNTQSGLKGICQLSDMRDIHDARSRGDDKANLAFDMFVFQIKKYIGAYTAALGRLDGVVFTGGIGENDDQLRKAVCQDLDGLGICLDPEKNLNAVPGPCAIHAKESRVNIWIIPTNEELQIAMETKEVLERH